ncbi:MAG: excinuclease ABC subunit UvrC [Pseudomonadales bacterium]
MSKATSTFDSSRFLGGLTQRPGIYQMYNEQGDVLYVGKAKNLKNRVSSYFRSRGLNNKTVALVAKIADIQVTITNSETEALLLEQNLIKQYRPPYNILLRDDKSFPHIFLSDHASPRISIHRGAKRAKGKYFGPYPNSSAVRESLAFLQKTFKVRQCEDSVFNNRSRPCLQYQIGRCTGPCVAKVSKEDYDRSVEYTRMFLEGKSQLILTELADGMEAAAQRLEFEVAAELRDQITALQVIRERQYIEGETGDLDIIALVVEAGIVCAQVMYVRQGRVLGSKSFFPQPRLEEAPAEIMAAFIAHFYTASSGADIPRQLIVSPEPEEADLLASALSERAGRATVISSRVRSSRLRWLKLAQTTASQNCQSRAARRDNIESRFEALRQALGLDEVPERMECFDISHSSGEKTVASCVVFDRQGPVKSDYRRFNIDGITPGDDYAAMEQAITRRYARLQKGEGIMPDLLVIDGGKGQMTQAQSVLDELSVQGVQLLGIAKGSTRKPGLEHLYINASQKEITLASTEPALHLLQQIRDEAHRFAITGHKQRRDKARRTSGLEQIAGVGPSRRRELLRFFGGLQEVKRATAEEIARAPGISHKLAQAIYDSLHVE